MKIFEKFKVKGINFANKIFHILSKILYEKSYIKIEKNIENKYKDYYIFYPILCIGDLLAVFKSLKAFKEKNNGKILVIFNDKNRAELASSYKFIDKTEVLEKKFFIYSQYVRNKKFNPKIELGKIHYINPDLIAKTGEKFHSLSELYDYSLGVNSEKTEFSNLIFNQETIQKVNQYCKDLNLDLDKTIFLSPFANSLNYKILNKSFWLNLANKLKDMGFEPVFNCSDKSYGAYKTVYLSLLQTACFACNCHSVISFRSGLTDLLVTFGCKNVIALYPPLMDHPKLGISQRNVWKSTYVFDDNLSDEENMYKIFSINSITGEKSGYDEIICNMSNNELQDLIINKIKNIKKEEDIL